MPAAIPSKLTRAITFPSHPPTWPGTAAPSAPAARARCCSSGSRTAHTAHAGSHPRQRSRPSAGWRGPGGAASAPCTAGLCAPAHGNVVSLAGLACTACQQQVQELLWLLCPMHCWSVHPCRVMAISHSSMGSEHGQTALSGAVPCSACQRLAGLACAAGQHEAQELLWLLRSMHCCPMSPSMPQH